MLVLKNNIKNCSKVTVVAKIPRPSLFCAHTHPRSVWKPGRPETLACPRSLSAFGGKNNRGEHPPAPRYA